MHKELQFNRYLIIAEQHRIRETIEVKIPSFLFWPHTVHVPKRSVRRETKKAYMMWTNMNTVCRMSELVAVILVLIALCGRIECGCRVQERNKCETICQWNSTLQDYECNLRAIVILPKMDKVEASLPRVSINTITINRTHTHNRFIVIDRNGVINEFL